MMIFSACRGTQPGSVGGLGWVSGGWGISLGWGRLGRGEGGVGMGWKGGERTLERGELDVGYDHRRDEPDLCVVNWLVRR